MINTIYNFKQINPALLKESLVKKSQIKVEAKDPEEHQIIEGYEGDCEQCEQEKIKKACTICGQ